MTDSQLNTNTKNKEVRKCFSTLYWEVKFICIFLLLVLYLFKLHTNSVDDWHPVLGNGPTYTWYNKAMFILCCWGILVKINRLKNQLHHVNERQTAIHFFFWTSEWIAEALPTSPNTSVFFFVLKDTLNIMKTWQMWKIFSQLLWLKRLIFYHAVEKLFLPNAMFEMRKSVGMKSCLVYNTNFLYIHLFTKYSRTPI